MNWLIKRGISADADGEDTAKVLESAHAVLHDKNASSRNSRVVQGQLSEKELARTDLFFIGKRKAAVAKERAGEVIDALQETW